MKPHLTYARGLWICCMPNTWAGFGITPAGAYYAWLSNSSEKIDELPTIKDTPPTLWQRFIEWLIS